MGFVPTFPEDNVVARIDEVDLSEARKVRGYVQTVRKRDFLAVVARSEWAAIKAARAVRVYWRPVGQLPDQASVFDYWLRIQRVGSTITSFRSVDGVTWAQVGTGTVTLGTTIYVGLAVTSKDNTATTTAVIDNVLITPL